MDFITTAQRRMVTGQVNNARERLLASIEGLTPEQMAEPGVCGEWSVAEVLSHIAAWDRATAAAFAYMLGGVRPDFLDMDEEGIEVFNAEHHATDVHRTPEEARDAMVAAREELVAVVRGVDNAALFAPPPGEESGELSIAACLRVQASHDDEHAEMIEEWRRSKGV